MSTRQQPGRPDAVNHEPARRASTARPADLDAVWQRYCDVIRELEMTATELEARRNRAE